MNHLCSSSGEPKNYYLGQHPEIYMAPIKEMHHFATDLISPKRPGFSRCQYLGWFGGVENEKVIGQSAVYYLYSEVAAQNIFQFNLLILKDCLLIFFDFVVVKPKSKNLGFKNFIY